MTPQTTQTTKTTTTTWTNLKRRSQKVDRGARVKIDMDPEDAMRVLPRSKKPEKK